MSKQQIRLLGGLLSIVGAAILIFALYSYFSQRQLEAQLEAQVPGAVPVPTIAPVGQTAPGGNAPPGGVLLNANALSPSVTPLPTHATPVQPDPTLAADLARTPTAIVLNPGAPSASIPGVPTPISTRAVVAPTFVASNVKPQGVPRGTGSPATRILIPRLGLDTTIEPAKLVTFQQNGQLVSDWNVPFHAVGHLVTTAQPGEIGNAVISGHHNLTDVNTFGLGLFAGLWNLAVGDQVTIFTADGKAQLWRVTDSFPVKEGGEPLAVRIMHAEQIMRDTPTPTLTLLTCWNGETNPLSGNLYRWVVHAELVAVQ